MRRLEDVIPVRPKNTPAPEYVFVRATVPLHLKTQYPNLKLIYLQVSSSLSLLEKIWRISLLVIDNAIAKLYVT